ncbi:hypothetical protein [Mycobacterium sp.]|uniref:hypothetical protein n=1 Tax=Mycobacterium sp. TaxID=1785 RepID=UPI003F991912
MNDLERRFQAVTIDGVRASKALGYNPTEYLQMVSRWGAVGAATRVVLAPLASGFVRLTEMGHVELTTETTVVNDDFAALFSEEVRLIAQQRLAAAHQFVQTIDRNRLGN